MEKYIKTADFEAIVEELESEQFYGTISVDRIKSKLTRAKHVEFPRINNIDSSIALLEKAANANMAYTDPSLGIILLGWFSHPTITAISKFSNISRPTLTKWIQFAVRAHSISGKDNWKLTDIDDLIDFLHKVKTEQER